MSLKEQYGKYGVYALIIVALFFGGAYLNQLNINSKTQVLLNKIAIEAEDKAIALEKAEAPAKKLSSYEESRKIEIEKILELENEIKTFQEAKRFREEMKDDFEKQIRCQRASLSSLEEGDCDNKDVYDNYSIVSPL